MEIFFKGLRTDIKWLFYQRLVLIFFLVYLPLRLIFHAGFVNPIADYFIGFITVFSPILLFVFFPFRKFGSVLRGTFLIGFGLLILGSLLLILFKFLNSSDNHQC